MIKYWDRAWSLVDGCTQVSEACDHCWLRSIYSRFGKEWDKVQPLEHKLVVPLKVKKPTTWAVWSDLCHPSVPEDFIVTAFEVMSACPRHTFLVLTKRPERLFYVLYEHGTRYLGGGDYIPNVWLGTTVELSRHKHRIDELRKCLPFNLFLSVEPMLEPLPDLDLQDIGAVICGCESGPRRRETKIEWVRNLRDQCEDQGVPFYLKKLVVGDELIHLPKLDGVVHDQLQWRTKCITN